jgi:ribosomal protein S18 acetylase RimI-like enzyme
MELRPLTKIEYEEYLEKAIESYGNELSTSGMVSKEKAQQTAQSTFNHILPDGFNTKDNYFYHAYDQNTLVGFIWYALQENAAYICDFYIEEPLRKKGYGKKVMLACEEDAKKNEAKTIGLHVFGHNKAARALYESLNYVPTSIQMKKELY